MATLLLATCACFLPEAAVASVACAKVMSFVNRAISRSPTDDPDLSEIAKQLKTSTAWVERCMLLYGRRPQRPGLENPEGREAEFERLEADEPEEKLAEDKEQPDPIPWNAEKERRRPRPTPTPYFNF